MYILKYIIIKNALFLLSITIIEIKMNKIKQILQYYTFVFKLYTPCIDILVKNIGHILHLEFNGPEKNVLALNTNIFMRGLYP